MTVPANGYATVSALQVRRRSITSPIERSADFFALPLNLSADDKRSFDFAVPAVKKK